MLGVKSGLLKSADTYALSPLVVKTITFAPLVIVFLSFVLWSIPAMKPVANWMLLENNPVELLSFISLLGAGMIGFRITWLAKKCGKGILTIGFYTVFAIGLIFVAMEEISWGQWFFGFDTPSAIKAINRQKELNLHNIPGFHAPFEILRVAFGVGGLFSVYLASKGLLKNLDAAGILSIWFVIIALLAALDLHNYFVPLECCPLIGPLHYIVAARFVEVLELLIGLSAFLYMWLNQRLFAVTWK